MTDSCNFSLQYPNTIQQTDNDNTESYQAEVILILDQILITYSQVNVKRLEGRINNQILGI